MRPATSVFPIFALAIALVGGTHWALAADGVLTLEVEGEQVTILRDRYGVPHVMAGSERAVYFGNGYAIAQDRLAQMEAYRRSARGELAQMAGPGALKSDISTRRTGYTEAERQAQFDAASPIMRMMAERYTAGVNRYLSEIERSGYPGPVKALGVKIRPWRVTDTVAVGQLMARRFGGSGEGELRNSEVRGFLKLLFGKRADDMVDDLIWINDPQAPTTIPRSESPRRPGRQRAANTRRAMPPAQRDLLPKTRDDLRVIALARAEVEQEEILRYAAAHGLPTKFGSYAIVVSGKRTLGGHAILVGGPQMGFRTPQIAHEVHLVAPGLDVIGMGFAGVPGALIGHNQHLAWSTTTGVGDVADTYVEKLNPENPEEYWFQGKWRKMEKRVETFAVRGADPQEETFYRTVHGPVVSLDRKNNRAYSVRYSYWNAEFETLGAIAGFSRARNIREFAEYVRLIPTSHNWLCATQEGDIGYWFAGRFPRRPQGVDGRFPIPGTGEYEWEGFLEFEELPQIINPRQGFLANWNNKPAVWWDHGDTPVWGPIYRVQRIADLLKADSKITTPKLIRLLGDIGAYQDDAEPFVALLAQAMKGKALKPRPRQALDYLLDWDRHNADGSIGKTLYDAYLDELRELIFDEFRLVADKSLRRQALRPGVVLRVLLGDAASVPMKYDYLGRRTAEEAQREAFRKAVRKLTQERGPQVNRWGYQQGEIRFRPLPGIPKSSRGTYIQIVELGRPQVTGVSILPPGQSEDPEDPHYDDQRELAGYWRFKPMLTERKRIERQARRGEKPAEQDR